MYENQTGIVCVEREGGGRRMDNYMHTVCIQILCHFNGFVCLDDYLSNNLHDSNFLNIVPVYKLRSEDFCLEKSF